MGRQGCVDLLCLTVWVVLYTEFDCVACAVHVLQEVTLQGLLIQASNPHAAAARQQGSALLRDVLSRAFLEADPQVSIHQPTPMDPIPEAFTTCAHQNLALAMAVFPHQHSRHTCSPR